MNTTTATSTKEQVLDDIKLLGSEPTKEIMFWVKHSVLPLLILFGIFIFKWTLGLLADVLFVWTPEILVHAWKLYGEILISATFAFLFIALLIVGVLFC